MIRAVSTIGVYGFNAASFFAALERAGIDTFCDVRARRGVRGREYAFANATRLQAELNARGIRYLHFPELAPSAAVRAAQGQVDQTARVGKRQRTALSPEFVDAYGNECLSAFDAPTFVERLGVGARHVVLFCVERDPGACHRSLLAARLEEQIGLPVTHLRP